MDAKLVPRLAQLLVLLLALAPRFAGATIPKDIVLVLDNSGSMQKNDPKHLTKVAVRTFLKTLGGDTDVAVLIFDQGVRLAMPLTPLNEETRPRFLHSLDAINFKGLLTDSPAALERAIYELKVNGRTGVERSILFMTDGIVDTGNKARDADKIRWMREELAPAAAEAGVRIFGIAFTENADFELIQSLAQRTRGAYYRAFTARELDAVFSKITALFDASNPVPAAPVPDATEQAAPSAEANTGLPPATPIEEPPEEPPEVSPKVPPKAPPGVAPPAAQPVDEMRIPDSTATAEAPLTEPAGGLPALSAEPDEPIPSTAIPDAQLGEAPPPATEEANPPQPETPASTTPEDATRIPASVSPETAAPGPPPDTGGARGALDESGYTLLSALAALFAVVAIGFAAYFLRRKYAARKPDAPGTPKAFLNDLCGVTDQPSYELTDKVTVIGRIKGADAEHCDYIVIDEPTVGRRHSIIEYKDHAYWVADQSSINGTFVNSKRIEGGVRLKHGDRIRFHKHEFEFLMLDMFETDRTMVSATMFATPPKATDSADRDDDRTQQRPPGKASRRANADPTKP